MRTRGYSTLAIRSRRRTNIIPRLDVLEDRRLMAVAFVETPFPVAPGGYNNPILVTHASDGAVWTISNVGQLDGASPSSTRATRTDPQGVMTDVAGLPGDENPIALFAGDKGSVWAVTDAHNGTGHIVRLATTFSITANLPAAPLSATLGADGDVWITTFPTGSGDSHSIERFDPRTGVITPFALPGGSTKLGPIITANDGNLWTIEPDAKKVVKVTPAGQITEYPIPIKPWTIAAGAGGGVWVAGSDAGGKPVIAEVTPGGIATLATTLAQPLPGFGPSAAATSMAAAPDGSLWFINEYQEAIGHLKSNGSLDYFPQPQASRTFHLSLTTDGATGFYFTQVVGSEFVHLLTDAPDPGVSVTAKAFSVPEGPISSDTTIASFTTPDAAAFPFDFTARYQLDDQSPQVGTVLSDGRGGFVVRASGSDSLQSSGFKRFSVTVLDAKHDNAIGVNSTATGFGVVGSETITISPGNAEFHTGLQSTGIIGTLHDPAQADLFAYATNVDWGDGTTSHGQVRPARDAGLGLSHDHDVKGSHTYSTPGTYTVRLYASKGSSDGVGSFPVVVTAPPDFSLQPVPIVVGVGEEAIFPVAFVDKPYADLALFESGFKATIDWGDGTAPSTTNNTKIFDDLGIVIQGKHAYGTAGSWTVHVTLVGALGQAPALTLDEPATSVIHQFPLSTSVKHYPNESYLSALTPELHTAFNVSDQSQVAQAGYGTFAGQVWQVRYGFTLPHTYLYAPPSYEYQNQSITLDGFGDTIFGDEPFKTSGFTVVQANVTLRLEDGRSLDESVFNVVAVHNAARNLTLQTPKVVEGETTRTLLAKFDSDNPGDFAANYAVATTVDFGPTQSQPMPPPTIESDPAGGFDVWQVVSPGASSTSGRFSLLITRSREGDAIAQVSEHGTFQVIGHPVEGLTPVTAGYSQGTPSRKLVATFHTEGTDAKPGDFSAAIDLGGQHVPAEVTADPSGGFDVWATILFSTFGEYPFSIDVTPPPGGGAYAYVQAKVIITPAPITAMAIPFEAGFELTGPPPGLGGPPFDGSVSGKFATFTSANPRAKASDFRATITSSDGGSWDARIGVDYLGGFGVEASHKFPAVPSSTHYTLTIKIDNVADYGAVANAATLADTVLVAAVLPPPPPAPPAFAILATSGLQGVKGLAFSGVIATINDPIAPTPSQYAATVDWGDGSTSTGLLSAYGEGIVIYASHVFGTVGIHAYSVTAQKSGGVPVTASGVIAVSQPDPVGIPAGGGPVGGGPVGGSPMTIVSARSIRNKHGFVRVVVTLSGTLDTTTVSNAARYMLTEPGKPGKHGTKDKIDKITSATYNPSTKTLTLVPKGTFRRPVAFRVGMLGSASVMALAS